MALNAQILVSIIAHESSGDGIAQTLRATPATYALALTDGTGANQAQLVWSDSRTATNDGDVLDLTALADDRGTVSFTAIKAVYVRNTGAVALLLNRHSFDNGNVTPANSWASMLEYDAGVCEDAAPAIAVPAGGAFAITAPGGSGYPVSSSSRNLAVAAPGSSTTYDIVLIGEGTVT
jgi:hypothetical protein